MGQELYGQRWLADAAATVALGAELAARHVRGVVYLLGDLGAGKTTLVRGWLNARGVRGPVKSPTYTLVEPYDTAQGRVLHLDLYRLKDPRELLNLGLEDDPPQEALWLVEWPQCGAGVLAAPDLRVELRAQAGGRSAFLHPESDMKN